MIIKTILLAKSRSITLDGQLNGGGGYSHQSTAESELQNSRISKHHAGRLIMNDHLSNTLNGRNLTQTCDTKNPHAVRISPQNEAREYGVGGQQLNVYIERLHING